MPGTHGCAQTDGSLRKEKLVKNLQQGKQKITWRQQVMKRVLTFLAILLLPLSVWAMTPVSDSDLSNVTGQAGVNINADVTMNIGIGTVAWGDASGVDAYASLGSGWAAVGSTGYVGVTNFNINNLRIKARETDTYGTGYSTAGTATPNTYNTIYLKPITIDVATDAGTYGGRTFVRFGLGSLQITLNAMSFSVQMGATTALGQELGTANLGSIGIFINPKSYVDIYSHDASGVSMTMNVIVDQFNMTYLSWGDSDGLAGGNTGTGGVTWISTAANSSGYIGLANLSVGGPITVSGTVAIDVVTSAAGAYAHGAPGTPTTICHISFPGGFNVNVTGPITAQVKLDNVAALTSGNAGTLGDIYISGFNLSIINNVDNGAPSWVDIWAH
jgi:hypothetical protein